MCPGLEEAIVAAVAFRRPTLLESAAYAADRRGCRWYIGETPDMCIRGATTVRVMRTSIITGGIPYRKADERTVIWSKDTADDLCCLFPGHLKCGVPRGKTRTPAMDSTTKVIAVIL